MMRSHDGRDGLYLGILALAVVVSVDVSLGGRDNFAGVVVVAPVLTAALSRPSQVVAVGAPTVAASLVLSWYDRTGLLASSIRTALVLVGVATAVWVSHRRYLMRSRLKRVTHIADLAQEAILDPIPARVGPARFAGWYISATEGALVGGDFYQVVQYKDRARWIIGDVRGHGIDAVRSAAAAIGAFREAAELASSLGEVLEQVNHRVGQYLDEEGFATAILAELDPDGRLSMVNCGHPPPVRIGSPPELIQSALRTLPLGLQPASSEDSLFLSSGECVWFHTDGVIEAKTRAGSRGLDAVTLADGVTGSASDVAGALLAKIEAAAGADLRDDSAALVVQYSPEER